MPAGTYDVVGSYVGYRLGKQSITVGPTPQQVTLQLAPTGNQLGEVVVKPEPNKPEEYQKFAELFLGGTTFSEQCHISNPDAGAGVLRRLDQGADGPRQGVSAD